MYNNIKTLRKIGKKISGIEITFNKLEHSQLTYSDDIKKTYINLNFDELDNTPISTRKIRKHNVTYFYFIVLLHEIGHYRQFRKLKSMSKYKFWYNNNYNYAEKTADRYASKYYKRYVRNTKVG